MHCWVSGALSPGCNPHVAHVARFVAWLCGWCGVLCENCIVDASIKPCAVITILLAGLFGWLLVVGVMVCVISVLLCFV